MPDKQQLIRHRYDLIAQMMSEGRVGREAPRTESEAVGSEAYVSKVLEELRVRAPSPKVLCDEVGHRLIEPCGRYEYRPWVPK